MKTPDRAPRHVVLNTRVPADLAEKVRELAEADGQPTGALVRAVIAGYTANRLMREASGDIFLELGDLPRLRYDVDALTVTLLGQHPAITYQQLQARAGLPVGSN